MPSVTLNKKVVQKLAGTKLSDDELKERIPMLGTDLEGIEGDDINVEIFPDRPDMLSEQGFARAFSSFLGNKTGLQEYKITKGTHKVIIDKSVQKVRPYTSCAIIRNLKLDDEKIREIIQIQEKLHVTYCRNRKKAAIGIYPIEKITFPITYFAADPKTITFQPLEFPKEITALQVLSKHPTGRDFASLLEGYDKFPFFKDANDNILSMPPVINSHNVGKVTEETTDVFIECSGFDYKVLEICINMLVTAFADMGGKIESMELEYADKKIVSPTLEPEKMNLDCQYINKRLGLELTDKEIITQLEKMGFGYEKKSNQVLIPSYRADVLHPVDLAEDVAIAYGYENFEETIPKVATVAQESKIEILKRKIATLLIGLKIQELYTYTISSSELHTISKVQEPIMLANSLSEEYDCLRSSMVVSLLEALKQNRNNEYPQMIFDQGIICSKDSNTETGIKETQKLAVALCEDGIDFTRIKQVLDYICTNLEVSYEIKPCDNNTFIPGRVGSIIINGNDVGVIGELHPEVLTNTGLEYPVAFFELTISALL